MSDGKFYHLNWRPVTAIRAADTDGDPQTVPDPDWTPLLPTPPDPEYPSGHAGYSGAAEQVLRMSPRDRGRGPAVRARRGGRRADGRDDGTARLLAGTSKAELATFATVLDRALVALRTAPPGGT